MRKSFARAGGFAAALVAASAGLVAPARAAPCASSPSGLISSWTAEGNASDAMHANDGALVGGLAFGAGKVGQAFVFDGGTGHVEVQNSSSLNIGRYAGFTMEGWILPGDLASRPILEWADPNRPGLRFWANTPNPGCLWAALADSNGSNTIQSANGLLQTNFYQHVAFTYVRATGTARLYLNGSEVAQTVLGTNLAQTTEAAVEIGFRAAAGGSTAFLGSIDELAVYNRTLVASEIQSIYNAGSQGKCPSTQSPPFMVQDPSPPSQTSAVSQNVDYSVQAEGTPPLSYQWRLDGVDVPGETSPTLTLTGVAPRAGGAYVVVVTNLFGSVTSAPAVLNLVAGAISINGQQVNGSSYVVSGAVLVTIDNYFQNGSAYYTLDGTAPTTASQRYSGGFVANFFQGTVMRVILYGMDLNDFQELPSLTFRGPICTAPVPGIVAWWRGENDATDSAGSNDGVSSNIFYITGEVGQAFNFTGGNVRIPATPALDVGKGSGFSLEAWVNPRDRSSRPLFEWATNGVSGVHLWINFGASGTLYANIFDTAGNSHPIQSAGGLVDTNRYQHVAATYDHASGVARLFVNGLIVKESILGVFTPQTATTAYIGYRPIGSGGGVFSGVIDEMTLYNRALSPDEVQTAYFSLYLGKCMGPAPAALSLEPRDQTVQAGTTAVLVSAGKGSKPLSYQWQLNGLAIGGATNANLSISNIGAGQVGPYRVIVTNAFGAATSGPVNLHLICLAVMLNFQPASTNFYKAVEKVTVGLQNFLPGGKLYYTLDGSAPTPLSPGYVGEIVVRKSCLLRAATFNEGLAFSAEAEPVTLAVIPTYTLSYSTPGGGSVSANPPASVLPDGTLVSLVAQPAPGWQFLNWTGDAAGSNPALQLKMTRDKSVQAIFGTRLQTIVGGAGSVAPYPFAPIYPFGTTVQLSALAAPGNFLAIWGSDAFGSSNPLSFVMTKANPVVSCLFLPTTNGQLNLVLPTVGSGRVTSAPQLNVYSTGQLVTITALPDARQSFLGWSGDASGQQNPLSLVMDRSRTVTANFSRQPVLLSPAWPGQIGLEGFRLVVGGVAGQAYSIDVSTNATTWTSLAIVTNVFGTVQFDDSASTNLPVRFYRAVQIP